jgi:hypothetical protein
MVAIRQQFIGTWHLVRQVSHNLDGSIVYPRGEEPLGILIYDALGHVTVQLMRRDRALHADMGDLDTAMGEYLGYFGTYSIDEASSVITHHVRGASFPPYIGSDQRRQYTFSEDGEVLILSADGLGGARTLTWQRAG